MQKRTSLTIDLAKIAIVVALMVVFTLFVSIPLDPIPITFQTAICICSGMLLGSKKGAIAMFTYFFLGFVCHLPVFSGFTFGFISVIKPSFGYIIGFIPAAFLSGLVIEKSKKKTLSTYILAAIVGMTVNYLVGIPYFIAIWKLYLAKDGLLTAVLAFNLAYIPKDVALSLLAAVACKHVNKIIGTQNNSAKSNTIDE